MAAPSRRAARARTAVGAVLGLVVGVVTGVQQAWDAEGRALFVFLSAFTGYYLALWTVILQTAAASRRVPDDEPRNVPVGL
ncbi:hypothetical protein [Geodermatophilus sp. SYSU D00815]